MRPYSDANWWVLALFAGFFVACAAVALVLIGKRDVGRGMFAERRGPATAPRGLLSPLGLAWRLQRGILLGWAAAVAVYGLAIGTISNEIEGLFDDLEQGQQIIERIGGTDQIIEGFFATVIGLMGSLIAIYTLQVLLRMRAEEEEGTLDAILATSVSRQRWAMSWIANAIAGTVILLAVAGLAAGIGSGIALGDLGGQLSMLMKAAAVQLPATLVIAGIVVAAFGLLPRWAAVASWVLFGVAIFSGPVVGGLLELPGWMRDISPFSHTPLAPAAEITIAPLVALTGIAVLLVGSGLATFRQRDVATA
jgi:ABC-2 type transport system permease protein